MRLAMTLAAASLAFGGAVHAKNNVVIQRNRDARATPAFEFRFAPSPSDSDAAKDAKLSIVAGTRDENGGAVEVLRDGKLPRGGDEPRENFFFDAGTEGGRIVLDLGSLTAVEQVNTYSWHNGSRGPQVYTLWASDGKSEDFDAAPKSGMDPVAAGWREVARVDTRPGDRSGDGGGQYCVSVFGSEEPLGAFRYLLFELSRTEDNDPFGNTFYSEIDVIAGDPSFLLAAEAAAAGTHTVEIGDRYTITIDTSDAPELSAWARDELAPVIAEWYPKIISLLPSEGYDAPERVEIELSPRVGGVAATGGRRVRGNADWFQRNLKGEAKGAIVHELVHVVQQYGRGRRRTPGAFRPPGWLTEGIPDYIRWFLYEPESHGAEITERNFDRARYDGSYRVSANFLDWVVREHGEKVIPELNAALREGRYRPDLWNELTGHSVEELGEAWKRAHAEKLGRNDPEPRAEAEDEADDR